MADEPTVESEDAGQPGDTVFILERPIKIPGKSGFEEVSRITLREPTGADLLAIGNPAPMDLNFDPPRFNHDTQRMVQMLARLSNIPAGAIVTMKPSDLVGAMWTITPFFMPPPGTI